MPFPESDRHQHRRTGRIGLRWNLRRKNCFVNRYKNREILKGFLKVSDHRQSRWLEKL